MLQMLKGMGIDSPEQLQNFMQASENIKRMITLLNNEISVIGNVSDMGGMVRVPVKKMDKLSLEEHERLANRLQKKNENKKESL
jgi:hypothetical protein